jgi:hypothetical protein
MDEEEIQPPEFPFEFEDGLFEDFGNTSNYLYQKRPPVPIGPAEPLDKAFLKEMVRDLTAVMSSEWVQEGELSSEPLQIVAPLFYHSLFYPRNLGGGLIQSHGWSKHHVGLLCIYAFGELFGSNCENPQDFIRIRPRGSCDSP